jgi:GNAT superfamily N-acetyltransferase
VRNEHLGGADGVVTFREGRADVSPGKELLAAMTGEMAELYDGLDLNHPAMPKAGPAELGPPDGALLIGFSDTGEPICCGGVKRLADGACEIKRMYVTPAARGRGVARALLTALESRAHELGYTTARLDTGHKQPHARRLYESQGYVEIGNFNDNPVASFFGEKQLR